MFKGNSTVMEVARYFIAKGQINNIKITHLKIQKLVYYAQGLVLACTGDKLFNEEIQAWVYGPVCPALYQKLKQFASCSIHVANPEKVMLNNISDEKKNIIDEVWRIFGEYDEWKLVEFTHQEDPWLNAMEIGKNTTISCESLKKYFSQFVRSR